MNSSLISIEDSNFHRLDRWSAIKSYEAAI